MNWTPNFVSRKRLRLTSVRPSRAQLIEQTGLTVRTFRYYRREGIIGAATGRGLAASYNADELGRLRTALQMIAAKIPRKKIRKLLEPSVPSA